MFNRHLFSAAQLFTPEPVPPLGGMPAFANHSFIDRATENRDFRCGAGLYFIGHRDGHECVRVLYIGMFLGSIQNVFGGDLIQARWSRHISTIGLRGQRVSISKNLQLVFAEAAPTHPITEAINLGNPIMLAQDRGYCVSANRLKFAAQNWTQMFSHPPTEWIDQFVFGYVQLSGGFWRDRTPADLRDAIQKAELELIKAWSPVLNGRVVAPNLNPQHPNIVLDDLERRLAMQLPNINGRPTLREGDLQAGGESQKIPEIPGCDVETLAPEAPEAETVGAMDTNPADEDAIDAFNERLPDGCPSDIVDRLRLFISGIADANIHYTGTNGGDLRVRVRHAQGGRKRNVFTMYWQARNEHFFCRALVAHTNLEGPGISNVRACAPPEPLWSQFTVNCVDGCDVAVTTIVKTAIQNFQLRTA